MNFQIAAISLGSKYIRRHIIKPFDANSTENTYTAFHDPWTTKNGLLIRKDVARRLLIVPETLAVWDCTRRYDLRPVRISGRVYYKKTDLIRYFLKSDDMSLLDEPLLDRLAAAQFIDKSPPTLAVWDCTNQHNLHPIKVGNRVRYAKKHLIAYLDNQLEGKIRE